MIEIAIRIASDDPDEAVRALTENELQLMPFAISDVLFRVTNAVAPRADALNVDWLTWAATSTDNYEYLWNYAMDILDEFHNRYGFASGISTTLNSQSALPPIPTVGLTDYPGK